MARLGAARQGAVRSGMAWDGGGLDDGPTPVTPSPSLGDVSDSEPPRMMQSTWPAKAGDRTVAMTDITPDEDEEGGQPDADDELLARWQEMVGRPGEYGHGAWVSIANGLASARRRTRDDLRLAGAVLRSNAKRIGELERELAEARHGRADSDALADHFRTERDRAEARSHGEVLAEAMDIIRLFAAQPGADRGDGYTCGYCSGEYDDRYTVEDTHLEECPWRRAVALVVLAPTETEPDAPAVEPEGELPPRDWREMTPEQRIAQQLQPNLQRSVPTTREAELRALIHKQPPTLQPEDRPVPPTYPTYEEVRAVIVAAWRSDCPTPDWMDLAAHNLMALLSGVPTEPEEATDGHD